MSSILIEGITQTATCLEGNEIKDFLFTSEVHLRVASFSSPIAGCDATTEQPRNYLQVLNESTNSEQVAFNLNSVPIADRCGKKQLDVATGIGAGNTTGVVLNFGVDCNIGDLYTRIGSPIPTPEPSTIILVAGTILFTCALKGIKKCFTLYFTSSF